MLDIPNPQKRNVWISLGFGLLGLLMMFFPLAGYVDIMKGGGALIMIGLLFLLSAIPVALMFNKRAQLIDSFAEGRDLLAHWRYAPGLWAEYAGEELVRDASRKKALFFTIAAFALIFGVLFLILDPEGGGPATFLVMMGLIVVIGITALLSIRLSAARNREGNAEVYISADGLYLNRVLHSWGHINTQLESVRIVSARVPVIEFVYSYPTRAGMQSEIVNVPIPHGEMPAARKLVEYFN
ncbi:MAG: hypothetical protein ABRQ26_14730 [Syntrophomonadaceae bacterium]